MNCSICQKPITLSPSASERAAKDVTSKSAAYYTSLFRTHVDCEMEKRKRDTLALMQRITKITKEQKLSWPLLPKT